DNASAGGRGGGGGLIAQNWLDLDAERGNSSLVRRQTVSINMQYSTGMGARGGALVNGWKGALLKGWTLTGNSTVQSGPWETPTCTSCIPFGTGIGGTYRADYTGAPIYLDGALNRAAFAVPVGHYGNAGRNIIQGPTTFSLNGSAGRIFRLGERRSADLRFEAQNVLNHVNFGSYNTAVGTNQFGILQPQGGMRTFSAILRFRF